MRFLFLAALPLLLTLCDPVTPGDPALDPSLISAGTDSLVVLVKQGDQLGYGGLMILHTWTDEAVAISRTERIVGPDGADVSTDSFALDPHTLAPTYRVVDGTERTDRGEGFHPNSVDVVLAALPLADGYSAELALESDSTGAASVASVRVLGVEDVPLISEVRCPSWKVEVVIDRRLGLYFIDQGSRRLMRYLDPIDGVLLANASRTCGRP